MKLHILSDLHLSVQGMAQPATSADVVVLAGDISRPERAAPWALGFGKPVLYVIGNHEFYGSSLPEVKTAFLFTRVGLAGADMGACGILPRIIGQGRASELLYTWRMMSAEEGQAWGFFNGVVAQEDLLATANNMAQSLADGPAFAHSVTKKCLHQEWNQTIEQALETEAEAQAICMQTEDFKIAYHAFVAKETPKFIGN